MDRRSILRLRHSPQAAHSKRIAFRKPSSCGTRPRPYGVPSICSRTVVIGDRDADERRMAQRGQREITQGVVVGALPLPAARSERRCRLMGESPIRLRRLVPAEVHVLRDVVPELRVGGVQSQGRQPGSGEVLHLVHSTITELPTCRKSPCSGVVRFPARTTSSPPSAPKIDASSGTTDAAWTGSPKWPRWLMPATLASTRSIPSTAAAAAAQPSHLSDLTFHCEYKARTPDQQLAWRPSGTPAGWLDVPGRSCERVMG
ncbi:MAG: hypothetical protein JWN20_2491 [Jatrophihabitantaceae bacterium]|nr:hypothetical protein [Jatrophihabitantaceae bacterium]